MNFKTRTLEALRNARDVSPGTSAVVGLDGFVDTIVKAVGTRTGPGDQFSPIRTIPEFAARIAAAAGKSTNIELHPVMEKLGGNGPIMANALLAAGTHVAYVGAVGRPVPHPVFADFAARAEVVSLGGPAMTTAIEFEDGKIMLGQLNPMDQINMDAIDAVAGREKFRTLIDKADLVALVNWTMIPHMTTILRSLRDDDLPHLTPGRKRIFFFDLADPEKRSREDLLEVLAIFGEFERCGEVVLGLNLKEAQRVHEELGFTARGESEDDLRATAAEIREKLGISTVVVHPRQSAACATADGTFWVPGPYTDHPLITTGAGDHFNAGFVQGRMLGLDMEACLTLGVCTSGHYVRTAASPSLDDLQRFLETW